MVDLSKHLLWLSKHKCACAQACHISALIPGWPNLDCAAQQRFESRLAQLCGTAARMILQGLVVGRKMLLAGQRPAATTFTVL